MAPAMKKGQKRKVESQTTANSRVKKRLDIAQNIKRLSCATVKVHPKRVRCLLDVPESKQNLKGPVLYWMSRDQRVEDNWAFLYAVELAQHRGTCVGVVFNLLKKFMNAGARQFVFMLEGLKRMQKILKQKNIAFFLTQGNPGEEIPSFMEDCGASALVTDFSPMRLGREWKDEVVKYLDNSSRMIPVYEVDAHNVVPVWVTSDKREYAARTIRPKITKKLPEYLKEYPQLPKQSVSWPRVCKKQPEEVDWSGLIEQARKTGAEVPEVSWVEPGEEAAMQALLGPQGFLRKARLSIYATARNDPSLPGLSGLSPYFHFGHLSPQRAALEASKQRSLYKESVESFLEEMIVRRELSDNYCFYVPHYDKFEAAYEWAQKTLNDHRNDVREYTYTLEQLEKGKTHDNLWNAAQLEMTATGKMHGYIRMYWAKKILEWTETPEQAIKFGIYLNDKWELDGRDPNGYVGIMWSMCGIHDRAWVERPIFGKIRYMNYNGCKRKFDIAKYEDRVNKLARNAKLAFRKVTK